MSLLKALVAAIGLVVVSYPVFDDWGFLLQLLNNAPKPISTSAVLVKSIFIFLPYLSVNLKKLN